MTLSRFLRGLARAVACASAIGAFGVAGWVALEDHTATASAAGAVGLALMILAALDLESFEGLGIKAKLKDTLADAEGRVRSLDKITIALARSAFVQAARGPADHDERQAMVADLTEALTDSKMDAQQIQELKRPFFTMIALGLWYVFGGVRAKYSTSHINYAAQALMRAQSGAEKEALQAEFERLKGSVAAEYPNEFNVFRFRNLLEHSAAITPLAAETAKSDRVAFDKLVSELADMFEESVKLGNYSPETLTALKQGKDTQSPFMQRLGSRLSAPPV